MEDGHRALKIVDDHFEIPNHGDNSCQSGVSSSPSQQSQESGSGHRSGRKPRRRSLMFNLFRLPRMLWSSTSDEDEKVEIDSSELASLRSELADLEEREAYLKAQLEHVDEILRSARLAGYLFIRTRWTALPGEPPPIDDSEVDDWLPRFVVLHGACIFIYLICTDLSPQESILLADITEIGELPSFTREDGEIRHSFSILTKHGLRFECSSSSRLQVESWLEALKV